MRDRIAVFCLLLAGFHVQAGSTVYRCIGSAGEVTFSQTACGDAPVALAPRPVQSIGEGLRASESAWLKARQGADESPEKARAPVTDRAAQEDRQTYRCLRARQQLDAVQAERRRGYRAGKGGKLRERAARYRTYLDSFCS